MIARLATRLAVVARLVAAAVVAVGSCGLAASLLGAEWTRSTGVPDWQRGAIIASFAGIAIRLLLGRARDPRVGHLGTILLLIALFFARPPIAAVASLRPALTPLVAFLRHLTVDAFLPVFVWLFVRDFPRAIDSRFVSRVVQVTICVSLVAATFLTIVNLAIGLGWHSPAAQTFSASNLTSQYWTVIFGLILPAPIVLLARNRRAPNDERRRVGLFLGGVLLGSMSPILVSIVGPFSTTLQNAFRDPLGGTFVRALNFASMLVIAGSTAYAVAVQKILDVGTLLRKAAQYALARLVIAALAGIPLVWIGLILYRARGETLVSIVTGPQALPLAALVAAEIAVLRLRVRVMAFVDRLFFREAYDARRVLAEVVDKSRTARTTRDLVDALTGEVERALHPTSVALLVESAVEGPYVALRGPARTLERDSALVARLSASRAPLRVDLERLAPPLDALPDADRVWLADAGAEALVPLVRSDGGLAGLLALGPKQSELGYSRDDLLLLATIGASAGLSLENLLLRDSARTRRDAALEERLATECVGCGHVEAADASACSACGGALRGARLPRVLFDKFELEARVGEGAMGIVYRARDLALGRAVALKTLPATSPEDSVRLRREARAMAAIRHPHLALIFGAETWQGDPILVLEYLARGTLADRIARGPLPLGEALRLGAMLADVLDTVHGSGLLHRDVKPSNVGFTEDGAAKLLDFGLARIAGGEGGAPLAPSALVLDALGSMSLQSGLAGTPIYMAPEALAGERAEAGFDLWSLAVVIYEAASGRHPFEHATAGATWDAIRHARLPRWDDAWPTCPPPVRALFERTLSAKRGERPASARELAQMLASATEEIAA